MTSRLREIFEDEKLVEKIKRRLPNLFWLAELDSSRAKKIGMEVGSLREKILVALLIYKFGRKNVQIHGITEREADVWLFGQPISIKTITGSGGVKIIWTVDPQKAIEFREQYTPSCDTLLAKINWGGTGCFYYVPLEVQRRIFRKMGRDKFIKLPKPGTNPRGAEFSKEALTNLLEDKKTKKIEISWERVESDYDPYKRWVDYWKKD